MEKSSPKRMCVVCRQMFDKKSLIRIVKTCSGEVKIDETGKTNGRGAYLCKDINCIENAKKRKALDRALNTTIGDEIFEELRSKAVEE